MRASTHVGSLLPSHAALSLAGVAIQDLTTGRRPVFHRVFDIGGVIHQFEFEQRRLADDLLRPFGILNARELDQNILLSLPLDDRFADPELVDTVANGFQRLVHGIITQRTQLLFTET